MRIYATKDVKKTGGCNAFSSFALFFFLQSMYISDSL